MKIVHKHIVHMHLNKCEMVDRFNHAQHKGRFVTESKINGVKVRTTYNNTLLLKIQMIKWLGTTKQKGMIQSLKRLNINNN